MPKRSPFDDDLDPESLLRWRLGPAYEAYLRFVHYPPDA